MGIYVDERARTVQAQAACWRELVAKTQVHGLATTGGVVSSGVPALTLGGGLGWLMPKWPALDNLRSVELVRPSECVPRERGSSSGSVLGARGGGGNFGIAASLDTASRRPMITGGLVPSDPKAKDVLQFTNTCRSRTNDAPPGCDGAGRIRRKRWDRRGHCGTLAQGDGRARTRRSVRDGRARMIPCSALNSRLTAPSRKGALNYWKAHS
jgi:hypothetical protein